MKRYRLIVLLLILLTIITPYKAQDNGLVTGFVHYEDQPVPGVEVFLGIQGTPFVALYTCTDINGYFEFTDLPLNTQMTSAAGFEVEFGEQCSNPFVLAPSRQPLLLQTWQNHSGGGAIDPFTLTSDSPRLDMNYDLEAWPTGGDARLNNMIISSIRQFQLGHTSRAVASFERFQTRVAALRVRGILDIATAEALIAYSDIMISIFNTFG